MNNLFFPDILNSVSKIPFFEHWPQLFSALCNFVDRKIPHLTHPITHNSQSVPIAPSITPIKCRDTYDDIHRRSWALFEAREVMRSVIESFKREQTTCVKFMPKRAPPQESEPRSKPRRCRSKDLPGATTSASHGCVNGKRRDSTVDLSQRPHTMLSEVQEAIVLELRSLLLLPLDDLLVVVREFINLDVSRAGLNRCLRRHGVSSLRELQAQAKPDAGQDKPAKSFKDYEPGFIYVDIKYLPQMPDE